MPLPAAIVNRLRQAGVGAARITQLSAAYDTMTPPQQDGFRRLIASRPDEVLRRTYDPGGTPDAEITTAQVVADPALLTAVQTAILAAHDTDAERETFAPARLSQTALKAAFVAAVNESGSAIPGKQARVVFNSDGDPVTIELVAV